MKCYEYLTAAVTAQVEDDLVTAKVVGEITPVVAAQIVGAARGWSPGALARIVNYEHAAISMTADVLFAAVAAEVQIGVPVALVVARDQLAMFREYTQMNAARGLLKAAFTNDDEARRWAAEQARVQGCWQRLAGARRSLP